MEMERISEEVEEYGWREVILPSLIPVVHEPELERETGERRRGRDVLVAIDFGPKSKHAFDWALAHFVRLADTIHLVHAVGSKQLLSSCTSYYFIPILHFSFFFLLRRDVGVIFIFWGTACDFLIVP
jgi:Universal stress protein family